MELITHSNMWVSPNYCVRRTFLCGIDSLTGKDYSHQKQWIAERLALLAKTFAIDVCAYSLMSNHMHTVLFINVEQSRNWTEQEVIKRWGCLFTLPVLVELYETGQCVSDAEQDKVRETIDLFRERLTDISWFMRCLNEPIARKANEEDKCTGRFWEGRFKSQALLNEQALIACMTYVDLNPIRADICDTLEASDYTSVKQRIEQVSQQAPKISIPLFPFISGSQSKTGIPFSLKDYLELTDWTGRSVRIDKRGFIKADTPKILHKLGLDEQIWIETVDSFSTAFHSFVGPEDKLKLLCKKQKKKWLRGIHLCRKLFHTKPPNLISI
ncbi:MAG: transposase [Gammaproteobacteria bacterium]|nr:transposase [Gammaproteobacteria bacterium]